MGMVVEYIRYKLKDPERGAELLRAYQVAAQRLEAAEECLAYELTRCEEDETSWILRIEWKSTEAHLEGFRKGPEFPGFLAAIREFIPEIVEMKHYALTEVMGRRNRIASSQ